MRETLDVFRPAVEKKIGCARRWIILLAILLSLTVALSIWLSQNAVGRETGEMQITASEAVSISPYILITRQDTVLLEALRQDENVTASYTFGHERDLITLDRDIIKHYESLIDRQNLTLTYFIVQVIGENIHVEYGTELIRIILDEDKDGTVQKAVLSLKTPYPYVENGPNPDVEMEVLYTVYNQDNMLFSRKTYAKGLAALL